MNDEKSELSEFPFKFPPAAQHRTTKRNKSSEIQVPDQPGIEYLLLRSLAEHLKISADQHMWRELALRLARELMPEPMQQGAPLKWTSNLKIGLIGEVQRLMDPRDKSKGISFACHHLATQKPWSDLCVNKNKSYNEDSLRKKYYELRKKTEFFAQGIQQYKKLNKEGRWKQYIDELST